jgi:hypothetical protein
MKQEYYRYIHELHLKQVEKNHLLTSINKRATGQPALRKRFLLAMSDTLLGLGQRIRPAEFQVQVHAGHSHENVLEIKAGGC